MKKPGVVLAPAGITVRELIDEYCGGMAAGHSFKGYLPGGASGRAYCRLRWPICRSISEHWRSTVASWDRTRLSFFRTRTI